MLLHNSLNNIGGTYLAIKTYSKDGGKAPHNKNLGPEWRCEAAIIFPLHPLGIRCVVVWVGLIGSGT
jgi:hypothetical protein